MQQKNTADCNNVDRKESHTKRISTKNFVTQVRNWYELVEGGGAKLCTFSRLMQGRAVESAGLLLSRIERLRLDCDLIANVHAKSKIH